MYHHNVADHFTTGAALVVFLLTVVGIALSAF